jgi:hypothetical protein
MQISGSRVLSNPDLDASLRRLGSAALGMLKESIDHGTSMSSRLSEMFDTLRTAGARPKCGTSRGVPCCPPVEHCPPACLLLLTRRAVPGEVILVPFRIHNGTGAVKSYAVGLRPMMNDQQQPAPTQPSLDKTHVTIQPGQSVALDMRIDLSVAGYHAGQQYEATIVVREKDINQNICFRLVLDAASAPTATPCDERDLKSHFVGWQYHFYCDERDTKRAVANDLDPKAVDGEARG